MSTYTTNYNLEKPDSTDDFKDFRSNYNSNMDIIDANLGGGGGGNVDDVLVNGVSVVDGNHDAQITSYKEVTQAEYDALPATKLTDGIAYFIKDAGGGGGGSSSHNYSTTEQVIGTWIDGKPLYEITISGTVNGMTSGTHTINYSDIASDIKEIIDYKGRIRYNYNLADTDLVWYNINATESSGAFKICTQDTVKTGGVQTNTFNIVLYNQNWAKMDLYYITFQYTKTTDV